MFYYKLLMTFSLTSCHQMCGEAPPDDLEYRYVHLSISQHINRLDLHNARNDGEKFVLIWGGHTFGKGVFIGGSRKGGFTKSPPGYGPAIASVDSGYGTADYGRICVTCQWDNNVDLRVGLAFIASDTRNISPKWKMAFAWSRENHRYYNNSPRRFIGCLCHSQLSETA